MSAPHPLTAVEVEALRQMRTRLAKTPASDAAAATLGRAALQVLARSGVPEAPPTVAAPLRDLAAAADGADSLVGLSQVTGAVAAALAHGARTVVMAGALQALIGGRLRLAGRERVEPRA